MPFSVWRTGSKDIFQNKWLLFSFVAFLAVAGLVHNYHQWFKLFKTLTSALLVFTIISNVFGIPNNGRLFLTQGKFSNPNEMAQALLLGLSVWLLLSLNAKSGLFKATAGLVMLIMLFTVTKTGSRGALIAFGVLVLCIFLRSTSAGKMKIIIGGGVLLAVIVGTMPKRLLNRYRTLAEAQDAVAVDDESSAYDSTNARKDLLRKSIRYTFEHPLFGVGPGMFLVAEDAEARAAGRRHGSWQGTHNSYTQVSSELGILACMFYVMAIFFGLKKPSGIHRKTARQSSVGGHGKHCPRPQLRPDRFCRDDSFRPHWLHFDAAGLWRISRRTAAARTAAGVSARPRIPPSGGHALFGKPSHPLDLAARNEANPPARQSMVKTRRCVTI